MITRPTINLWAAMVTPRRQARAARACTKPATSAPHLLISAQFRNKVLTTFAFLQLGQPGGGELTPHATTITTSPPLLPSAPPHRHPQSGPPQASGSASSSGASRLGQCACVPRRSPSGFFAKRPPRTLPRLPVPLSDEQRPTTTSAAVAPLHPRHRPTSRRPLSGYDPGRPSRGQQCHPPDHRHLAAQRGLDKQSQRQSPLHLALPDLLAGLLPQGLLDRPRPALGIACPRLARRCAMSREATRMTQYLWRA